MAISQFSREQIRNGKFISSLSILIRGHKFSLRAVVSGEREREKLRIWFQLEFIFEYLSFDNCVKSGCMSIAIKTLINLRTVAALLESPRIVFRMISSYNKIAAFVCFSRRQINIKSKIFQTQISRIDRAIKWWACLHVINIQISIDK